MKREKRGDLNHGGLDVAADEASGLPCMGLMVDCEHLGLSVTVLCVTSRQPWHSGRRLV
jgi:hypothetical protein